MSTVPSIVLATLNARYIHASLGLRYLLANMGALRPLTVLREFTIQRKPEEIVDELLGALKGAQGLRIVGLGVYIWNVVQTTEVVRLIKAAQPDIRVVLGGPEVSHEWDGQEIVRLADHVITGWGDISFGRLCQALFEGLSEPKIIQGLQPPLSELAMPYREYSDKDLSQRTIYVEASRGCPFKCEFCLSALDKTAWAFDLDVFLGEMAALYERGARNFKFVDRTFNLKPDFSIRILQFFLDRLAAERPGVPALFLHFEVVPDHLPERLRQMIVQFPAGVLQFEVGIQTFNPEVQQRISRRQDNVKAEANLRWLMMQSNVHLHADLIFGLPGETPESFASGFDQLYRLGPHEIQLGMLKRLRGTPIIRHTAAYGMRYDEVPPYVVRETAQVDVATMQRFARFARYWDVFANSGRFGKTMPWIMKPPRSVAGEAVEDSPFNAFMAFADWLWRCTGKTHGFSPEWLVDLSFEYLCKDRGLPATQILPALLADYLSCGARGSPQALRGMLPKRMPQAQQGQARTRRQQQHLAEREARQAGALPPADKTA